MAANQHVFLLESLTSCPSGGGAWWPGRCGGAFRRSCFETSHHGRAANSAPGAILAAESYLGHLRWRCTTPRQ
jgi:hypothetical protein